MSGHASTSGVTCVCPGYPFDAIACVDDATQEDFLCNWCRSMDCPTVTSEQMRIARVEALYLAAEVPF